MCLKCAYSAERWIAMPFKYSFILLVGATGFEPAHPLRPRQVRYQAALRPD